MKAWFDFLDKQTIQPLRDNNSLCALPRTGTLYVGGEDATEFLQNQLSNDISLIDATHCQLSSSSNAKGRLFGIYRVIQIEGGYLLLMDKSTLAEVMQRLQKFILLSKVVLADISGDFACFSITTDQQEIISNPDYPSELNQVRQTDSLISIRLQGPRERTRYLFLTNDAAEAIDLYQRLAEKLALNDAHHWRLLEMESGIPTLFPATQDAFVLQMCNLDLLHGVSFKKGCYPGQEVVARTHYLGKLKRRMFMARIHSNECPAPGDELTTRGQSRADGSGKIVDAVRIDANICMALFVANMAKAQANELSLLAQPDAQMELGQLPYSLPERNA